jgi:sterol desaturase/sphingolipid hydroxylase (fatty acid hydroxylase superfamily)
MDVDYQRQSSARMFESDFFEYFSKVHPSVPFIFYIPIITALMVYAFAKGLTTWTWAAAFLVLGWMTWDALEYAIHRKFFHWEGSGPFTRKLHDIVHGYHHKFPDDAKRLVMPLGASIPLAVVIAGVLRAVGQPQATIPYFCGIVAGYLFYDFTHWSTHYRAPLTAWGRAIRSHHMAHHFACPDRNFGISHRWIDVLLGTLKKRD